MKRRRRDEDKAEEICNRFVERADVPDDEKAALKEQCTTNWRKISTTQHQALRDSCAQQTEDPESADACVGFHLTHPEVKLKAYSEKIMRKVRFCLTEMEKAQQHGDGEAYGEYCLGGVPEVANPKDLITKLKLKKPSAGFQYRYDHYEDPPATEANHEFVLHVPFHPAKRKNYCSVASLQMVLAYYEVHPLPDQDDLKPFCPFFEGCDLKSLPMEAKFVNMGGIGDLEKELRMGHPVIIRIKNPRTHSIVVIGHHRTAQVDEIIYHDPAKPSGYSRIPTTHLLGEWKTTKLAAIVIGRPSRKSVKKFPNQIEITDTSSCDVPEEEDQPSIAPVRLVSDTSKSKPTPPKTRFKGIKIRIYPNKEQQILLNKTFGSCRFIHNKMLEERNKVYAELKEDKDQLYAHKYKTEKQYKEEYAFLKEVDSKALQSETRNLLQAFQNFFEGLKKGRKVGYPRFRSKKRKQTYTTHNINNNTRVDPTTKRIRLPKVGWVKYRDSRDITHPIKHVTVSKTRTNKFFVAIIVEIEIDIEPITKIPFHKIEAFDMSAPNFLVSEAEQLTNPRFYRTQERKLTRLHRLLSRKQKGSKNREKARFRLAKFYEKIQNQKMDWTHKLTHSLSNQFDAIILEDLNIEGMKQFSSGLAKSVTLDFSWYQFTSYLQYKMKWQGKHLVLVDRFFPSSKRCSVCGQINNDLELSERTWTCQCGVTHDRDVNASKNIKEEGINLLIDQSITIIKENTTVGTMESYASGDRVRPTSVGSGQGTRKPSAFRQW